MFRPTVQNLPVTPVARRVLLGATALFGSVVVVASVAMLANQRAIRNSKGCAFEDGISYCAQATGKIGTAPFTYRPLVPFAARIVRAVSDWSLVGSFQFVAACGFLLTICSLAALARGTALRSGVAPRQAWLIAFGAVLLWISTPYALRFVLTAPTFVDELATGLAVTWLAVFFARGRLLVWVVAPVLAILATLAREVGIATVGVTCLTAVILRLVPLRHAVVNCVAAAGAFVFDLSQPHLPHPANSPSMAWEITEKWIRFPHQALSALLMGTGLVLFALTPFAVVRTRRALADPRYVSALVPTAVVLVVSSAFLGRELPRFSSVATPILCLLLAFYLVLVADALRVVLLTAAAFVFLQEWMIFDVVPRTHHGYAQYFYGRETFHLGIILLFVAIGAVLAVVDLDKVLSRPEQL